MGGPLNKSNRIDAQSPQGKLAAAMANIFRSPSGKVLRTYLEQDLIRTATFAVGPDGERLTAFGEGKRALAIQLIAAADVDAKNIVGRGSNERSSNDDQ